MSKVQLKNATILPHFKGLNITVEKSSSLAISGTSKKYVLETIGCFHKLESGFYQLEYHRNETKDLNELAAVRLEKMGFVARDDDFIEGLTVLGNLELPYFFQSKSSKITAAKHQRLEQLSRLMGMHNILHEKATVLDSYKAKCASIIRALINSPSILLLEDPSAHLTTEETELLLKFLNTLKIDGVTVIMSSEDPIVIERCDQQIIVDEIGN